MLKLVHDRDRLQPPTLPLAGGALARLPGPVLWVSADGQVLDANIAAIELMLDVGEAVRPLREAILSTLTDQVSRQARVVVGGDTYLFQLAMSVAVEEPHELCVIAIGQAIHRTASGEPLQQ